MHDNATMAAERVHPTTGGDSPAIARTISLRSNSFESPQVSQPPIPLPPGRRPLDSSPARSTSGTTLSSDSFDRKLEKQAPTPPGTYVIQLPKEQIFSYPPPENQKKYQSLTENKKPRGSCCCRCLCYTIAFLLIFVLTLGIAAAVLYLVFRPEAPKYSVSDVSIRRLNVTSLSPISPEFDISIRADNKNRKIGIYYQSGSEVEVSYGDVILSNGALPVFYQPSKNVTVFNIVLKGSNVVLANAVRSKLGNEQRQGKVPFRLNVKAPVKIKVGAVKTWEITIKVKCDIFVDAITEKSRIISRDCHYSFKLW